MILRLNLNKSVSAVNYESTMSSTFESGIRSMVALKCVLEFYTQYLGETKNTTHADMLMGKKLLTNVGRCYNIIVYD